MPIEFLSPRLQCKSCSDIDSRAELVSQQDTCGVRQWSVWFRDGGDAGPSNAAAAFADDDDDDDDDDVDGSKWQQWHR